KHGAVAGAETGDQTTINGGTFELLDNPGVSDHCTYYVSAIYGGKFSLGNNTDCGGQLFYESTIATGYKAIVKDSFHYVVAEEADVVVANATDLQNALAKSETITIGLAAGEYGTIVMKSNKTIIGVEGAKVDCVNLNGADNVTIKNIVFDAATAKMGYNGKGTAKQYANIITGDNVNKANKGAHNLVIEGCVFQGTFASDGVAIAFTDQHRGGGGSGNVTIKGCTFDTVNANCDIYGHYTGDGTNGHGEFIILNNVFKKASNVGGNVYLGRYASSTPVKVSGNKFAAASLEDAMYVQDHSSYGVSVDASDNTFGN
ncbi:MAG: hypothetical protein IIX40_09505, partial [Alistipes sp.]|nr:hypothetical protein [Alistipes sp.]